MAMEYARRSILGLESDLLRDTAVAVAGAHGIGLTPEQLRMFLAKQTTISSLVVVTVP